MKESRSTFSIIPLAEYNSRRLDKDGDRIRVHELLDPDIDFDPTQPTDQHRIVQAFATNLELRQQNSAITFLAGIIDSQSDSAFERDTVDFHVLSPISTWLGTAGIRGVGYLYEDSDVPAAIGGMPAAWWESRAPIPINMPSDPTRPRQYVSGGFFTRWPTNHDLRKLIADSLAKPE